MNTCVLSPGIAFTEHIVTRQVTLSGCNNFFYPSPLPLLLYTGDTLATAGSDKVLVYHHHYNGSPVVKDGLGTIKREELNRILEEGKPNSQ